MPRFALLRYLPLPEFYPCFRIGLRHGLAQGSDVERLHDRLRGLMTGSRAGLLTGRPALSQDRIVELKNILRAYEAKLDRLPGCVKEGVSGFTGFEIFLKPVTIFGIRAGMTHETDDIDVEENGTSTASTFMDRGLNGRAGAQDICSIGVMIADGASPFDALSNPVFGGCDRDPEAVVFAHEEDGQRELLIGDPRGRVQAPLSGRVIERGVSEAADENGVRAKLSGPMSLASGKGKSCADGFWNMRSNG